MAPIRPLHLHSREDRGVSAVIGVILMVAITVAIAATVYIWAGSFGTTGNAPESASATAKVESHDGDSLGEWIKITLTSGGDGAPYMNDSVGVEFVADGNVYALLCDNPQPGTNAKCDDYFSGTEEWRVGSSKWFPCQNDERHTVTLTIQGQVILDRSVKCQQAA